MIRRRIFTQRKAFSWRYVLALVFNFALFAGLGVLLAWRF